MATNHDDDADVFGLNDAGGGDASNAQEGDAAAGAAEVHGGLDFGSLDFDSIQEQGGDVAPPVDEGAGATAPQPNGAESPDAVASGGGAQLVEGGQLTEPDAGPGTLPTAPLAAATSEGARAVGRRGCGDAAGCAGLVLSGLWRCGCGDAALDCGNRCGMR